MPLSKSRATLKNSIKCIQYKSGNDLIWSLDVEQKISALELIEEFSHKDL